MMASAIMHICVAKKVNEHLKMNEKNLILGSIAPDIAKQIGEKKNKSHFLNDDDSEYALPDIKSFLDLYKHELNKPFEMGYFIHLLTDKYWFRDYVYSFLDEYSYKEFGKTMTYTELKDIIYNDYSNINVELIDYYDIPMDLFSNNNQYPKSIIKEIPMDKIDVIVEKTGIIISNSTNEPTIIFDINKIIDFINSCAQKIIELLRDYKLVDFEDE